MPRHKPKWGGGFTNCLCCISHSLRIDIHDQTWLTCSKGLETEGWLSIWSAMLPTTITSKRRTETQCLSRFTLVASGSVVTRPAHLKDPLTNPPTQRCLWQLHQHSGVQQAGLATRNMFPHNPWLFGFATFLAAPVGKPVLSSNHGSGQDS